MEARDQQHNRGHSDGNDVIRSFIRGVAKPIAMMREQYVDPKILKKYQINLQPLSFTTGELHGGAQPFFEPVPASQIGKWLAMSDRGVITEDFAFPNVKEAPMQNSGVVEAARFWGIFAAHLSRTDTDDDLLRQTNWQSQINNIHTLNRRGKPYGSWQVEVFFTHHLGPDRSDGKDPMNPHITCFLADDAPLLEDIISMSELTTITVLACSHACSRVYEHAPHIPVTVISGSGRHVRIVQGILDTRKGSLELRLSRTISFDKGVDANRQDFLTLLGWVVAKPVGTSSGHGVK